MANWGAKIFDSDDAQDIVDNYSARLANGETHSDIVAALELEFEPASDITTNAVFWLSLASVAWKHGRLSQDLLNKAIQIIDTGADLAEWPDPKDRKKRESSLQAARQKLLRPQPKPKQVVPLKAESISWKIGEIIRYRLRSGYYTYIQVVDYQSDADGKNTGVYRVLNHNAKTELDAAKLHKLEGAKVLPAFLELIQPQLSKALADARKQFKKGQGPYKDFLSFEEYFQLRLLPAFEKSLHVSLARSSTTEKIKLGDPLSTRVALYSFKARGKYSFPQHRLCSTNVIIPPPAALPDAPPVDGLPWANFDQFIKERFGFE